LDRFIVYFKARAHDIINNKDKRIWISTPIKFCDNKDDSSSDEMLKIFMKQIEQNNNR